MMQRGMGLKTSVQRKLHKQEKMFVLLLSFLTQEDFLHLSGVAPEVADAHHDKTTLLVGAEGMHEDLSCCFLGEDMANKRPSSEPARQQSKSYAGAHVAFHVAYFAYVLYATWYSLALVCFAWISGSLGANITWKRGYAAFGEK